MPENTAAAKKPENKKPVARKDMANVIQTNIWLNMIIVFRLKLPEQNAVFTIGNMIWLKTMLSFRAEDQD